MGALAFPEDQSEPGTRTGSGGRGASTGGRGTSGGTGDEPDRAVRWLLRLRDLLKPSKTNVAPYVSTARAAVGAEDRRAAIERWRSYGHGRLIEAPPDVRETEVPGAKPDPKTEEALAQWQEQHEALLLLARAGDTVLSLMAVQSPSPEDFGATLERTQPAVSITRVPRLFRRLQPRLFPWRVEVRTTDPGFFTRHLAAEADWLGVGVDVIRGGRIEPLGHCQVPGGMEGTVAGLVGNHEGPRLQLTCAHVVASGCTCARWRGSIPLGLTDDPDAAILDAASTCFDPRPADAVTIPCATQQELLDLNIAQGPVRRVGGRRLGRDGSVPAHSTPGNLTSPATYTYAIDRGKVSRFPAIEITPRQSPLARMLGPFGRRAFSKGGDSGSWVLDVNGGSWVGMVVSGDPTWGKTYAINALELTRHLSRTAGSYDEEGHTWLT
jgi:hypothetical protein